MTDDDLVAAGPEGCWVAYYSDRSAVAVFASEIAAQRRPRTLDFDPARAMWPDLLTLCDCPWHPCSHNPAPRDWRFHLFGRFPLGPLATGQRRAPRARGTWLRLGSVLPVEGGTDGT